MTLATVTTSATTSGTTTTVLCPIQDLMDKDGSKPFIPVDKVSVTKDDSSVEFQRYDGETTPWIVSLPDDDSKQKPTMTIDLIGAGGQPAPEVTSVALSPDSNAQVVTVTITSTANEVTTYPRLQVNREGQILFSAPFVIRAILVIIVLEEPVDASMGVYTVSPNVQGCFRAEMTTIVTPTTIAAGTTTPSTTTVSSLSTTGTVVTTTTPTVTTTLSATAPPTDGSTHVTTAVVTTTITATGTTTVVCPLTGEMPKQTPDFNDEQLNPVAGEGTPTQDSPGVVRWRPIYAPETYPNPVLQINLVPFGATSTPLLQSVTVTEIRATTVTINVYLTVTLVYSITVTIPDDSGTVTVYVSPESKLPIEASIVEIVLGEPKDPYETMYDTTVTLVGCFEPLAGKGSKRAISWKKASVLAISTMYFRRYNVDW